MNLFNLPPITVHQGPVYFNPSSRRFFQIRGFEKGVYTISEGAEYYSDAKTHISEVPVSGDYIASSLEITVLDAIEGIFHDGIGWRAVEK